MKEYIFIVVCINASRINLDAQPMRNEQSLFQVEIGVNPNLAFSENLNGIHGALKILMKGSPVYFGIEGMHCYSQNEYLWPDIGKYSYKTNINCVTPLFGINIARKHDINGGLNIKYNFASYKGELITENPNIRNNLLNAYSGSHHGACGSAYLSYKFTRYVSCYIDFRFFHMTRGKAYSLFGIGFSYKFF